MSQVGRGDWYWLGMPDERKPLPKWVRYHRDYPNGDPGPQYRAKIERARKLIELSNAMQRRYSPAEINELVRLFSEI